MFESVRRPDNNAAAAPLAAFLFAQLYFMLYPLLERVPAALFWSVDLVLLAGVIAGAVAIARAPRSPRLVLAIAAELLCAWQFVTMTFPWV